MKKSFNIVCPANEQYVPICGIMLTSLFENNKHHCITVYVLSPEHTGIVHQQLVKLGDRFGQKVVICNIPDSLFVDYMTCNMGHLAIPALYRLAAALVLPEKIETACYFDDDMIILGDVAPIFDVDLNGYAMAGATDCLYFDSAIRERLGVDDKHTYVNAGVTLLNLNYWRENHVSEKCLSYLRNNITKLTFFDQDVINYICCGKIAKLPIEYNFQYFFICESHFKHFSPGFQNEIREAFKHPVVIHYCGPSKPWQFCFWGRPFANEWMRYQLRSPWPFTYVLKPYDKIFKVFLKRMTWFLGLGKNKLGVVEEFIK